MYSLDIAYIIFFIITIISITSVTSILHCPIESGGGVCPDNTKCCTILDSNNHNGITSGCIPGNKHIEGDGVCCGSNQYDKPGLGTGCAGKYQCSNSSTEEGDNGMDFFCSLVEADEDGNITDVQIMPRYELPVSSVEQLTMHGFPILQQGKQQQQQQQQQQPYETFQPFDSLKDGGPPPTQKLPLIAYYSNRKAPLTDRNKSLDESIQVVVITVHGSGRNADEYLYASMAVTQNQQRYSPDNVLVISPRFLAMEDGIDSIPMMKTNDVTSSSSSNPEMVQPLMWNEKGPIAHTWRYGANALAPWSNLSSYDVMDSLVEYFAFHSGNTTVGIGKNSRNGQRFPNLERIVVIGHSAGGQFVHRWALTSNSEAWGDREIYYNDEDKDEDHKNKKLYRMTKLDTSVAIGRRTSMTNYRHKHQHPYLPLIRVVAANPRSYCYVDERRFLNGTFQIPPQPMIEKCPFYNSWEWGLEDGGPLVTPYRDRAIDYYQGNRTKLVHRYAERDVIYLSGNNDTQHLRGSCADDGFQGKFRRERSEYFFMSLKYYFGYQVHSRLVVDNVGHDHSLMYGSKEGISAIFG